MHYANFAVFVALLIEIVKKKFYIITLANFLQQVILGKKNPVIAYHHTGLGPGRVGSRVTHQVQNVGRVGLGQKTDSRPTLSGKL